jgi:hypothetical protein
MSQLKITLVHGDLLKVKCSAIFLKHIVGSMSAPELALNTALSGRLHALYLEQEQMDHSLLDSVGLLDCPRVYVVHFHQQDLPFSYQSVDRYARTIVRVSASGVLSSGDEAVTAATAIHGPGAGLDGSEAMETLLVAFASELAAGQPLGRLDQVLLVEKHRDVFERLQDRLKYLATKNIVRFEGDACFLNPNLPHVNNVLEQGRVDRLSLKHLFVAMPYAKEFNNAYYFGIKHPIERRRRKCERTDQDVFTGDVVERVKHRIATAELVIADITGNNPNVFYEVGYAEGVGKPILLISQEQETPFDLKTRRQIRYDPQDIFSLANKLGEQLDPIIGPPSI